MKKCFIPVSFFVVLLFAGFPNLISAQQIFINEFLASNDNVNSDELGDKDDWIELYNAGSTPVNLGGMYLSDNLNNLTKWQIPLGVSIGANGYKLFWCDDETTEGLTHTNFKLSSSGEDLILTASDGTTIIDSYSYGPQTTNISTGRVNDGAATWALFSTPTPNASNNSSNSEIAAKPVASHIGGHYNNTITVTLSTTTPGATIRYTLDGSEPVDTSTSYNTPFVINQTMVLRARTFKNNFTPSRIMTHTYMYGIDHDFPIVCISADTADIFGAANGIYPNWNQDIEHEVHAELFEADGTFGFEQDLGIQIFGGFSQSYDHKSLSLTARPEYGNTHINYPLFPDLPYTQYGALVLRNSGLDWERTMFRDALASGLLREFDDVDAMIKDPDMELQAYRPAVVYLNGEYFGIHNMREKTDWRYLETHFGIDKDEVDVLQKQKSVDQGDTMAWSQYFSFVKLADFNNPADYATLETWIDPDHFTDYFLTQIYVDNSDWPGNNNRRWRKRAPGEKWRYFLYDLDRGLGQLPLDGPFNSGNPTAPSLNYVTQVPSTYSWNQEWSTLLLRKLLEKESFRIKFINRMADMLNIIFKEERIVSRIQEYEARYAPEIPQHAAKWWNNNNWSSDVNKMYIFADGRTDFMWDHFNDFFADIDDVANLGLTASPLSGGSIHLNTMHFREENFPWAGRYFEGVDVPLKAVPNPGYFFTGWSSGSLGNNPITTMNLNTDKNYTAFFTLGSTEIGNIVINEINYHAPDNCDAGDWIELFNAGNTAVNVSGWFLEDGDGNYFNIPENTTIPAQGYLVLVEDAVRFQNVHPQVTNFVAGFGVNSLTGNMGLSNGGEWISINNANRTFQDTVRYDDKLPWPEAADGDGATLQLNSPSLDNALPGSWSASPVIKGTPGFGTQGTLELGANSFSCTPSTVSLNAGFTPCYDCTYLWNTGATTAIISVNTIPGNNTFTVTVTDATGTSQTDAITITIAAPIEVNSNVQNVLCNGSNNGSILLQTNGSTGYNYLWNTGNTTANMSNLTPGNYQVTISDNNNCTITNSYSITEPPALTTTNSITQVSCYNESNGAILLTPQGGIGNYQFQWTGGLSGNNPTNLTAGNYTVTINDGNNCLLVENLSIMQPAALSFTNVMHVNNSCFGEHDGQLSLVATGGTGAYSYQWSTGSAFNSINNLSPGNYSITVSDNNACTFSESFVIIEPAPLEINEEITNIICNSGATGTISLLITGGTGSYQYFWNTGATTATIDDLALGTYTVTVSDAMGCQKTGVYSISQTSAISVQSTTSPASCFGESNGSINLTATGASAPYTFLWNTNATTEDLTNIPAGNYMVSITDQEGCITIQNYTVSQPGAMEAVFVEIDNLCFGESNGIISSTLNGGTSPYTFLWSNGATTQHIANLPEGNYTITITDNNGCTFSESAQIEAGEPIEIQWSTILPTCSSTTDGAIILIISGGSGNYSFLWSNGATDEDIFNLQAGDYAVTVMDDNNCITTVDAITLDNAPILTTVVNSTDPVNGNNGTIAVIPSGGNAPYSILWNDGSTDLELDNLADGTYTYVVTDANGCTHEGTVDLNFVIGIEEKEGEGISVFPNPGDGLFYIMSEATGMEVVVIDLLGRTVKSLSLDGTSELIDQKRIIDLRDLDTGVYFLTIKIEEETFVERVSIF